MNSEVFSEWLRRQDHRVVRTLSSYWYDAGPRVCQAFPFHWLIQPSEDELSRLFRIDNVIALRFSAPLEANAGFISYHAIYAGATYGLENLGKWARKNVRRGLKNCRVERISFERLAAEGWPLQRDTLDRQGRRAKVTSEAWAQLCLAAQSLPGFEAWGALVQERLVASVITFQMDDCGYMLYQQCLRKYLPAHVNNALSFVVTQALISRPGIGSIFYGLHSLDAPASVDDFKFRMAYTARPVRQRVVFHPWLQPFIHRGTHLAVKTLRRWYPGNPTLAKAEGMVRFYLEGKQALVEQDWPGCLAGRKSELLNL